MTREDSLKIIFMGTPEFAKKALEKLWSAGHHIVAVYTQPPRPAGRGHQIQNSSVHDFALLKNLPVFHPENFKTQETLETFKSHKADLAIVAAYGLILPKAVLESPRLGCWNIHASLLPRWRGASPIQRAIQYGDSVTGITIMQMDQGMDTGDILLQESIEIKSEMTSLDLFKELADLGGETLLSALELQRIGNLKAVAQDSKLVTYAPKILKEEGLISWQENPQVILSRLKAFTPWPGCFFVWQGQTVKLLKAKIRSVTNQDGRPVGTLLDEAGWISCQGGELLLEAVLIPGKKAMSGRDFLNGYGLKVGARLEP